MHLPYFLCTFIFCRMVLGMIKILYSAMLRNCIRASLHRDIEVKVLHAPKPARQRHMRKEI